MIFMWEVLVINISLTPMFMYCNAIVVLVGERIESRFKEELNSIPRVSLSLIISIYTVSSIIIYVFKQPVLSFFTNDTSVVSSSESILLFVILISMARPFFEVYKYCLQSFGNEKQVLALTLIVNMLSLLTMFILSYSKTLNIYSVLLTVATNYLVLFYLFRRMYLSSITKLVSTNQVVSLVD